VQNSNREDRHIGKQGNSKKHNGKDKIEGREYHLVGNLKLQK